MSAPRYILAGGGTSGHVNPALAIAEALKQAEPDADLHFCGTEQGIEHEMVLRAGYPFHVVEARGLPGKPGLKLIKSLNVLRRGVKTCKKLLRDLRPSGVVGTGGYVCSPLVTAAAQLKIPILLHEQNAIPGRANRLMARWSDVVCTSFPDSARWFPEKTRIVMTGNPVRRIFFEQTRTQARERLGLDPDAFVVLVTGGSLGAKRLNDAVAGLPHEPVWQDLIEKNPTLRLLLSAGRQHAAAVQAELQATEAIQVEAYLYEPHLWLAAADLFIGRAGAMTCAELTAVGRPGILVPYPYATQDHQTLNAKALVAAGAALMQPDADCTTAWLAQQISDLAADVSRRERMAQASAALARPEAAKQIAAEIRRLAK